MRGVRWQGDHVVWGIDGAKQAGQDTTIELARGGTPGGR